MYCTDVIEGSFISEFWQKVSGLLHGDLEGECSPLKEGWGDLPFGAFGPIFRGFGCLVSGRDWAPLLRKTSCCSLLALDGGKPLWKPAVSPEGRWVSACRARFKPEPGEGFGGGFARIDGLNHAALTRFVSNTFSLFFHSLMAFGKA